MFIETGHAYLHMTRHKYTVRYTQCFGRWVLYSDDWMSEYSQIYMFCQIGHAYLQVTACQHTKISLLLHSLTLPISISTICSLSCKAVLDTGNLQ